MFHSVANLLKLGLGFTVVFVEWGKEVHLSKQLIRDLGVERVVEWVPPMGKRELWERYCSSHAVLDQFVMPALGGVGFEAMALGRVLITRFDTHQLGVFFGAPPPALEASTVADLTAAMKSVTEDPFDQRGIGLRCRQWIENYHSASVIVSKQGEVYRDLLSRAP